MHIAFFDTHAYIKQLEASGIPVRHAEAHAIALVNAMSNELARKTDLHELRTEMRGQFALLKWMLGFILAGTAGIVCNTFI